MPNVKPGETKEEYIPRCIKYVMDNGEASNSEQAYAICSSKYEELMKLPTKEFILTKDGGVNAISLVDQPAIELDFVFYEKEKEYNFKAIDNEKRIACGPILIPDIKILRKGSEGYYNAFMSKETIEKVANKYLILNKQHNVTFDHNIPVNDVFLVESWLVNDSVYDKARSLGYDVPIGTWMASFKVLNDEIWNSFIKTGIIKGFSIEGVFEQFNKQDYIETEDDIILKKLIELLKNID